MTKPATDDLVVTFWGARGTLPSPGKMFERAGGNTNCIEVSCGDHLFIIDAGTGIRQLGSKLVAEQSDKKLHLLLTHAHYDHVEGIPFFAPFFDPETKIDVFCGELDGSSGTRETLEQLMRRPYFPVGPDVFAAEVTCHDLAKGEEITFGNDVKISTCALNHPGGATGYRIDYKGKSFACITDTEHVPGKPDQNIISLINGIDLFAYDASLVDEELPEFEGYGHSTHEEALRLAELAGAKSVLATHHMPFRTDEQLDILEKKGQKIFKNSGVAREGDVFIL